MSREAEVNLRALIESTGDILGSVDLEYRLLTFNGAFQRHIEHRFGVTPKPGMRAEELTPERAAFLRPLFDRARDVGAFHIECPLDDGQTLELAFNRIIVEGATVGISVFGKDITERKAAEESRRLLATMVESSEDAVFAYNPAGKILTWNRGAEAIFGYTADEAIGAPFSKLILPPTMPEVDHYTSLVMQGRTLFAKAGMGVRKDGRTIHVCVTTWPVKKHSGEVEAISLIARDVTLQHEAERELALVHEQLRSSELRYRTVFQSSTDIISISRLCDGTLIDVNHAFLTNLGYTREELIGRSVLDLGIWLDPKERDELTEELRGGGSCSGREYAFRRKNGQILSAVVSPSIVNIDGVSCIICMARNVTESRAAEETIKSLAFYDPLTGLPNRRLLLDRLQSLPDVVTERRGRAALLFIDLDNFKSLNDSYGYQAGDMLLREVARRLSACLRASDTVARVGGDEFAVMLENLSEDHSEATAQAKLVSDKILAVLREPLLLDGHQYYCLSSLGINVFGKELNDRASALQRAEIAMQQAKEAGRNDVRFFSPTQQAVVSARAQLEEELRLAARNHQFALHYQPQIERGDLTGAEALIRWEHPVRGLVMPDEFIPLAEGTGLIVEMERWALQTVCEQLARWASWKEASDLTIAVNISPRHLRLPNFVEHVMQEVNRTGARPKNLRLELTEGTLSHSIDDSIAKMKLLRAFGVRFSLDDFGTGYSSLSYLKQLPISRLKIDRAFVKDILVDAASRAIAQTIITLGGALHISVIAEGVETEAQRAHLAELGCDSYQGYLFSRALPIAEFEAYIQDFHRKQSFESHRRQVSLEIWGSAAPQGQ